MMTSLVVEATVTELYMEACNQQGKTESIFWHIS